MTFQVEVAQREKLKASLLLTGASGAGKTTGALLIAYGLMQAEYPELEEAEVWKKIAVIDTEHERSKLHVGITYDDVTIGNFLFINFLPPYSPDRFVEAIDVAKKAGAEVIIIDSLSHSWAKKGGLLDIHNDMGGRYQDWAKVNKEEEKLHRALFENNVHIIATARAKQEYAIEKNEIEKLEIKKMGTKPILRDEMEYEFTTALMIHHNHSVMVLKAAQGLFNRGDSFTIDSETGRDLHRWLDAGVDIRQELISEIEAAKKEYGEPIEVMVQEFLDKTRKKSLNEFTTTLLKRAHQLVNHKVKELNKNE